MATHLLLSRLFLARTKTAPASGLLYVVWSSLPNMHLVGIRTSLLEERPWLAERLLNAFTAARDLAMKRLEEVCLGSANRLSLPWLHADFEETRALMGPNYWPYGVPANRAELEWLCKQSFAQHLAARPLAVEELFHPSVLD